MVREGIQVCPLCGERIGVYEPVVVLSANPPRRTSLAREPVVRDEEAVLVHADCHAAAVELAVS